MFSFIPLIFLTILNEGHVYSGVGAGGAGRGGGIAFGGGSGVFVGSSFGGGSSSSSGTRTASGFGGTRRR